MRVQVPAMKRMWEREVETRGNQRFTQVQREYDVLKLKEQTYRTLLGWKMELQLMKRERRGSKGPHTDPQKKKLQSTVARIGRSDPGADIAFGPEQCRRLISDEHQKMLSF